MAVALYELTHRAHFEGKRVGTPFSLLKCLRERIMDDVANHFPAQNTLDCRVLNIQSQTFHAGNIPGPRRNAPSA